MNRRTIITVLIVALGLIVTSVAAFYILVSVVGHGQSESSTSISTADELKLHKKTGMKAEATGDTANALAQYEAALKLCPANDQACKIDMEAKITLLNNFLKQEKDPQSALYRASK